jgi:hypothetical protein
MDTTINQGAPIQSKAFMVAVWCHNTKESILDGQFVAFQNEIGSLFLKALVVTTARVWTV